MNVVSLEALCRKCDETFNPIDEDDLEHVTDSLGDPCGGQGILLGAHGDLDTFPEDTPPPGFRWATDDEQTAFADESGVWQHIMYPGSQVYWQSYVTSQGITSRREHLAIPAFDLGGS